MVLLEYLCPLDDLPALVQKETIIPVTKSSVAKKKGRGKYRHFTPKEKVNIGRYASKHGVSNAVKHFKEKA